MIVIGIETSCDETGLAVYDSGRGLLSSLGKSSVRKGVAPAPAAPEPPPAAQAPATGAVPTGGSPRSRAVSAQRSFGEVTR